MSLKLATCNVKYLPEFKIVNPTEMRYICLKQINKHFIFNNICLDMRWPTKQIFKRINLNSAAEYLYT